MKILAQILVEVTGKPRYFPDLEWNKNSVVDNFYIALYSLFGRRFGIRPEMSVWADSYGNEGRVFFTLKSTLIYVEFLVRAFLRGGKFVPFRLVIPLMKSPQGFPIPASPYLFAIAFVSRISNTGSSPTLTLTNQVVNSGETLFCVAFTNAASNNNPYTGITWNGSENLSQLKNDFNSTGTRVTSDIWQIAAPTAATANVVLTDNSSPIGNTYATSLAYSGAKTSGTSTNSNSNKADSTTTVVLTINGTASDSWTIGGPIVASSSTTAGTGFTNRASAGPMAGDSNGTTGGGNFTMNLTATSTDNFVFSGSEIQTPTVAAATLIRRMLSGVGT